jgi:hypothetical protein
VLRVLTFIRWRTSRYGGSCVERRRNYHHRVLLLLPQERVIDDGVAAAVFVQRRGSQWCLQALRVLTMWGNAGGVCVSRHTTRRQHGLFTVQLTGSLHLSLGTNSCTYVITYRLRR